MTHTSHITTLMFLLCLAMGQFCSAVPQVPEKDPAATGEPAKLLPGLENKHPRLFLTAEQLPQLRAFYNSEAAAGYRRQFLSALKGCVPPKICPPSTRGWVDGVNGIGKATMQTVALHYLLTGDKTSLARAKEYLQCLAGTANWVTGGEPAVENTPEAYAKVLETMKRMPPHADFYGSKLYIMGLGVENLTSAIGDLMELKRLLVYGFRRPWKLSLLKTVDPAIGKCTKLEVLVLNTNELTMLPDSITNLTKLKILSVGDNHLQNLSPAVTELVKRLDPRGLAQQVPLPTP